jgi:hypothetical protein
MAVIDVLPIRRDHLVGESTAWHLLRVAGTIEVGGFDMSLDSPLAQKRCEMLLTQISR